MSMILGTNNSNAKNNKKANTNVLILADDHTTTNELYLNIKKVYFDRRNFGKLVDEHNSLVAHGNNLNNSRDYYNQKLEPIVKTNNGDVLTSKKILIGKLSMRKANGNNNNNNRRKPSIDYSDFEENFKLELAMDLNKKKSLDPIQHAKLAFYESLLNKNTKLLSANNSLKNYKTFDLINDYEMTTTSFENSLNGFIDSSLDFIDSNNYHNHHHNGGYKANGNTVKRRVSINHFAKLENSKSQKSSTNQSSKNFNVSTPPSNRLSIIPEINEIKRINSVKSNETKKSQNKVSDNNARNATNIKSKQRTSKLIKNPNVQSSSLPKLFGPRIRDTSIESLNSSRNYQQQASKLEPSITFPDFSSKTLLDKFNLNIKVEEAFKYTKLLGNRTQNSSLDLISLKFPNLADNSLNT